MARIAGINIPMNKHVWVGLTHIYGVGRTQAKKACAAAGIKQDTLVKDLTDAEVAALRSQVGKLTVEGDLLTIQGHREEEKEVKEESYYCAERATGQFSRTISLPEGVAAEAVEASYKDGTLEVVIPKPAVEKPASAKVKVK